jgi:hypothetical protein
VAIPEAYINNVGSLAKFLEEIRTAGVPERVTFEFLKTLGFKSSNDRPIIGVLKAIGFLDANGTPTDSYRSFRDPDLGPKVLARALRSAYAELYLANTKAHDLPLEKLKGIIATKTSKGTVVVKLIASTFKTLAKCTGGQAVVRAVAVVGRGVEVKLANEAMRREPARTPCGILAWQCS